MVTAVLFAIVVAAAMIHAIFFLAPEPSWPRTINKTIPLVAGAGMAAHLGAPALLIGAMGLSAAGDFALSREGEKRWFIAGLIAFLAAHLGYIALFLDLSGLQAWGATQFLAGAAFVAYGIVYLALLWKRLGDMRVPVAAYVAVILCMGLAALTLGDPFIIAGAVLFIVSDSLLAAEMFVIEERRGWIAYVIWETYIAAQAAIALPFLAQMYA